MPHILSPKIVLNSEIMWMEGVVYEKENIYSIKDGAVPPVNYDVHKLKPHSLTHAEGSLHVIKNGKSVDQYFKDSKYFYGKCIVIKLPGDNYKEIDSVKKIYHWEVTKDEVISGLKRVLGEDYLNAEKVLISTEKYHLTSQGFHDPNYVLTLTQDAANFLVELKNFNLYGTSWKSSDFMPGSLERPIHKTLFSKAIVFELLDLRDVGEAEYFFVGFPLYLDGASESPVTPVLFTKDELK